jgi:hypothetical protein
MLDEIVAYMKEEVSMDGSLGELRREQNPKSAKSSSETTRIRTRSAICDIVDALSTFLPLA